MISWLWDVCEDHYFENSQTLLSSIGLYPFLYLLSLWNDAVEIATHDTVIISIPKATEIANVAYIAGHKLQRKLSKLLQQFILSDQCGHFHDSFVSSSSSSDTKLPSGLECKDMITLLSFCSHLMGCYGISVSNTTSSIKLKGGSKGNTNNNNHHSKGGGGNKNNLQRNHQSIASIRAVEIVLDCNCTLFCTSNNSITVSIGE